MDQFVGLDVSQELTRPVRHQRRRKDCLAREVQLDAGRHCSND